MRRKKMGNSQSRKNFSRNAGTHPKTTTGTPLRGGIRL